MDQLLYGSADGIEGRTSGGWGVIRTTPGIDPTRRDLLASLASVHLPQTMPQFPSAQDLARRSRRFRSRPMGPEVAICMSVEAGPDHTGRPGNVISHCAAVPLRRDLRTVDWFFSPGWVLPHGAQQVARATLSETVAAPAGWPATAQWLRDDPMRILKARWVVSAAVAVLQRGATLLVVAPEPEEGARWLSAILWMLPPGTAARYPLLVGEDARTMAEQRIPVPHIAVIAPDVDVPESLAGNVVDTTGQGGDEGLWGQMLADLLLQSDEVAAQVFARRDELLERHEREGSGEVFLIAHALKVAWLTRDGGQNFGQEEAIRQLLDAVGPSIRRWPELRTLEEFVGSGSSSPSEDAYEVDGDPVDHLDGPYLAEPTITRPDPVPADVVDEALAAAARLGTLEPLESDGWLAALPGLPEQRRRDLWLVAAAHSRVAPAPEPLAEAVAAAGEDAIVRRAARRVAARSEAVHGASRHLQELLGETWQ